MKPKIAVFDFASCEGCELQIANLEEQIIDLVQAVDVVSFREVMKEHSDNYDIAFVEGSIQRPMDEERIKKIRANAKVLISLGDCACTGCVNKLRNQWPIKDPLVEVYGTDKPGDKKFFDLKKTRAIHEVVLVDFYIRGCPPRKEQIIYYVKRLSWMPLHTPRDSRFGVTEKPFSVDDRSLVNYNPHKCILCRRCDVMCREMLGVDALGLVGKGPETLISTPKNMGFDKNGCIRCGQCVEVCSVGALETSSQAHQVASDLRTEKGMVAAIDSIAIASYAERGHFLKQLNPVDLEKQLVGALKQAGFKKVIQYDYYLAESSRKDNQNKADGKPIMLSWCKGAFNYAAGRIKAEKLAVSESNSPWDILLNEQRGQMVVLISPCTALKGVPGFTHVLSAMELDEMFKALELDIEFVKPQVYDGQTTKAGTSHPGFAKAKLGEGSANVNSIKITHDTVRKIEEMNGGFVDMSPCLRRCLSGGGCYPTTDVAVVDARRKWLEELWGGSK